MLLFCYYYIFIKKCFFLRNECYAVFHVVTSYYLWLSLPPPPSIVRGEVGYVEVKGLPPTEPEAW